MQRWWIVAVAVVGIGLALFLFPRPDTGSVTPVPDRTRADHADELLDDAPPEAGFGKVRRAERDETMKAKAVKVAPEVRQAQQRLADLRAKPDAQAAAKLIGAWSSVRKTLMETESEAAADFAERLRQPLTDLAEFRRDPEEGVPFDHIRTELDKLHAELSDSEFANEGFVPAGLSRHVDVVQEFDAKKGENGNEESP